MKNDCLQSLYLNATIQKLNNITTNQNLLQGGGSPTLDANTLNEPSVSYSEFLEKLNADQVSYVEFLAPNGDAAYVTFKASETGKDVKPVRIGEGYPLEVCSFRFF